MPHPLVAASSLIGQGPGLALSPAGCPDWLPAWTTVPPLAGQLHHLNSPIHSFTQFTPGPALNPPTPRAHPAIPYNSWRPAGAAGFTSRSSRARLQFLRKNQSLHPSSYTYSHSRRSVYYSKKGAQRAIMNAPAVTIVAVCIKAETGTWPFHSTGQQPSE